jgi:hypothetical protein
MPLNEDKQRSLLEIKYLIRLLRNETLQDRTKLVGSAPIDNTPHSKEHFGHLRPRKFYRGISPSRSISLAADLKVQLLGETGSGVG